MNARVSERSALATCAKGPEGRRETERVKWLPEEHPRASRDHLGRVLTTRGIDDQSRWPPLVELGTHSPPVDVTGESDVGVEPAECQSICYERQGFSARSGKNNLKAGFLESDSDDIAKDCIILDNEDCGAGQIEAQLENEWAAAIPAYRANPELAATHLAGGGPP